MFRDKCTNTFTKHCTFATRNLSLQLRPNLYPPFFSSILFLQPLLLYHVAFRRFRPPLSSLLPPFISFSNSFHCATIVFFLFFLPFFPPFTFSIPTCFLPSVLSTHHPPLFPWVFPTRREHAPPVIHVSYSSLFYMVFSRAFTQCLVIKRPVCFFEQFARLSAGPPQTRPRPASLYLLVCTLSFTCLILPCEFIGMRGVSVLSGTDIIITSMILVFK